jgi:cell division protease FtsH
MPTRTLTALAVAASLLGGPSASAADGPARVPFSEFVALGREGKLTKVELAPLRSLATATTADGRSVATVPPPYQSWIDEMVKGGTVVNVDMAPANPFETNAAMAWVDTATKVMLNLMMVAVFGFLVMTISGRLKLTSVGRRFRRGRKANLVTFADVAGAEEAKSELVEVVNYLRDPGRFAEIGARPPRGILLLGPPGNGKTLLAKAVAGEAGVPFHFCTGSDFVEMFAGLGARRVRSTFANARSRTPSVLFIDEIDAVGRKRNGSGSDVGREHDQTLNALLTELDGMATRHGLIVLAATNLSESLDPALVRPGRFDRHVEVPLPSLPGRSEILAIHARKVTLAPGVDLRAMARATPGFSGADLEALINDAALEASRAGLSEVTQANLESARDRKLLGGSERRSALLTPDDVDIIAFHEAGHALAATLQPACDPVHKATIVPRGRSLGAVSTLPERDRVLVRRSRMVADLVMAMAGRAAEEIAFGAEEVTGGALSDIEAATARAREMVTRYGLGTGLSNRSDRSGLLAQDTLRLVDEEVEALVSSCYATALRLLRENEAALRALAAALVERETLDGDEVRAIAAPSVPAAA